MAALVFSLIAVRAPHKFNLDFGSPVGELSYYLWIRSDYISRYMLCGIFQGVWNLTSRTYSGDRAVMTPGAVQSHTRRYYGGIP